ncbi:hypothetical protein EYC84_003650 [Monilinia fructicola]|uniref:Uncharacterized protein n=1 Tax=Monilinia fructicola TaxID=38448 RepID=A0A5M9JUC8_MONFR|nr:hypothetical protein EYC84_003650 [Monilinia fructicola]
MAMERKFDILFEEANEEGNCLLSSISSFPTMENKVGSILQIWPIERFVRNSANLCPSKSYMWEHGLVSNYRLCISCEQYGWAGSDRVRK